MRMSAYLFVHFREKTTPDGEQVHFSLSRDGFNWTPVNGGKPVLWAYYGDHGVRDFAVCRSRIDGRFYILATDLSLSYGMRSKYRGDWNEISRHGSKCLAIWDSDDLVAWSEQRLMPIGDADFGCLWAPDITFDAQHGDYIVHWSSSHRKNNYGPKAIYFSRTKDFVTFTPPQELYRKADSGVIDSAMICEEGVYYLFLKSEDHPANIILLRSSSPTGPFERMYAFDESMKDVAAGLYEAPALLQLPGGQTCLFIDYYGVRGAGQGYVPFVTEDISSGRFTRYDAARGEDKDAPFSFPYGFKHGSILAISDEEYARIAAHDWNED